MVNGVDDKMVSKCFVLFKALVEGICLDLYNGSQMCKEVQVVSSRGCLVKSELRIGV